MDIENIVSRILDELGLTLSETISPRSVLLASDVIECLIISKSIREASTLLDTTVDSLEQTLRRHLSKKIGKNNNEKWDLYLLSTIGLRRCHKCGNIKPTIEFSKGIGKALCKDCDNMHSEIYRKNNLDKCKNRCKLHYLNNKASYLARNALRRAKKLNATPSWADQNKIREIYNKCPEGYHVDHILPLQGQLVSGLHVENNLQYLTAEENLKKHNKFIAG